MATKQVQGNSDSNATAARLASLGPECGRSIQIISNRIDGLMSGEIVRNVEILADSHPTDARMILLSTADLLTKLEDSGNRTKVAYQIRPETPPTYASYKMFFLSQMVTDTVATPRLMKEVLGALKGLDSSEKDKAMLADNIFHSILQIQRGYGLTVTVSRNEITSESIRQIGAVTKAHLMDREAQERTGLYSIARYPPLIFNRGNGMETFSVEYAKATINNNGISRTIDDFKDPMLQVSASWNLIRLDKYMTQMKLTDATKKSVMRRVATHASTSMERNEQEAEKGMWLMASIAKTQNNAALQTANLLWGSLKKNASMEVIARYFTRILTYETNPNGLNEILSVLKDSNDQERAAYDIKARLES